jgi:hypothetical protein
MARAKARDRVARTDRVLQTLQRNGVRRGVVGGSNGWLWVAVASWGLRRLRRSVGSEPELVYRGELRPGQTLHIDHLPETYGGRRLRVRRR